MNDEDVVRGGELDHGSEIGFEPKADVRQQRGSRRCRQGDREDRVSVRRLLENLGGANRLNRAWLVLDDDPPAFAFCKLISDDAAHDVRRRAGGGRPDNADHVRWIWLSGDRRDGSQHGEHEQR